MQKQFLSLKIKWECDLNKQALAYKYYSSHQQNRKKMIGNILKLTLDMNLPSVITCFPYCDFIHRSSF